MNWDEIKQGGSDHYKTCDIEPIDLFKSGGMLWDKIVADIIKYAYRNRRELGQPVKLKDIEKIHHLADMLSVYAEIDTSKSFAGYEGISKLVESDYF